MHNASAYFPPWSRISSCDAFLTVNLPINVRRPRNAESVKWLVIFLTGRPTRIYPLRKEKAMNVLVIPKISFVGRHNCPAELFGCQKGRKLCFTGYPWAPDVCSFQTSSREYSAACYLAPSGLRCRHIFCPPLQGTDAHCGWGDFATLPCRRRLGIRFELKLLADRSLTNICLSASIAQVEVGDNLPNKKRVRVSRQLAWRHTWSALVFADNAAV